MKRAAVATQGALRVRSVVLFQASYHHVHTALMLCSGELEIWSTIPECAEHRYAAAGHLAQQQFLGVFKFDQEACRRQSVEQSFWTGSLCYLCGGPL